MQRKSILWVDDLIDSLGPYVVALKEAGFDVSTASSTADALQAATERSFDLALVDVLMPPPDGIELIRRLHPLRPKTSIAALSSYLYLDKYRDQLRALPFPVELIDKDIPHVSSPDFDARFIEPIRLLASRGVQNTITVIEAGLSHAPENPFDIPLVDFMRKSIVEKDQLTLRAQQLAKPVLDRLFAEGNIWVLLCGGSSAVRAVASTPDAILPEQQVMDFARSQQRAAFQFWRPVEVDDIWTSCATKLDIANYPTVTLDFDTDKLTVHFDTGAPWTFFSYEELLRMGILKPTTQFSPATRNGKNYWTVQLNISALLRSQTDGASQLVSITGQAVRDWEGGPFARRCDQSCVAQNPGDLCKDRQALVGRNLLTENGLILILDGATRKSAIGAK